MSVVVGLILFFVTVLVMEGFAYVMHRWVMHGPGWFLHESHHRVRHGRFELNDLYGVIFAIPSIVMIYGGVQAGWGGWATAVGVGIAIVLPHLLAESPNSGIDSILKIALVPAALAVLLKTADIYRFFLILVVALVLKPLISDDS